MELLRTETPERLNPQAVLEIEANRSSDLFFKCPVGGFASLNPGICPKCNEELVGVYVSNSKANGQTTQRVTTTMGERRKL